MMNSYYSILKKQPYLKMGKGPEKAFFQRGHTDGQPAHEKRLNITSHQGNANPNYNEISLHTCQNGYHQKDEKYQLVRMWTKGTLMQCWWERKLVQPLMENSMKFPQQIKSRITISSSNSTPGYLSMEMETLI